MCDTAGTSDSAARRAQSSWLEPGEVLGDWRIEKLIGLGGMGTVYEAVHVLIGKRAAIKVVRADMTPATSDRFVREAWVVNQIDHPNVVDIFEIGRLDDGRPYLVMELLPGKNLDDRMEEGRIRPDECIEILLQICAALQAAHQHGVVHRDLKPANIVLVSLPSGGTLVKLLDWGIARVLGGFAGQPSHTVSGTLLGTPEHMSPEQARGHNDVDGRSDIYALGTIAYEMFLEGPPFVADSVAEVLTMHLKQAPSPPGDVWPDIPRALEQLLLQMLAKAPADRPALPHVIETLNDVRQELARRRMGPRAPHSPTLGEYWQVLLPRRRSVRSLAAIAALGIAAAALVFGRAANARSDAEVPPAAPPALDLAGGLRDAIAEVMPRLAPRPAATAATATATATADMAATAAPAPPAAPVATGGGTHAVRPQAVAPARSPRSSVRRRSAPPIDPDGTIDPFL